MNALAEYGASSSSSDSDNEKSKEPTKQASAAKLPKPEFGVSQPAVNNSVFVNPFVQAEREKSAILEKHVKMVPVKDQTVMINGKKICWSYRKGRCRFGHNCKYAHDSDIQKTAEELEAEKQVPVKYETVTIDGKKLCWNYQKGRCRFGDNCTYAHEWDVRKTPDELEAEIQNRNTVVCEGTGTQCAQPPPPIAPDTVRDTDDLWEGNSKPKLKRPGLSQGIVPSKKVIKMYQQHKALSLKK